MKIAPIIHKFVLYLIEIEIWVLGILVAISIVSQRFLLVAVGIAALFWPIRWLGVGRLTRRTPADWAIGLLFLMAPVTLWATALPDKTYPQVLRLLSGMALYYALINWGNSLSRLRLATVGVAGVGLLLVPVGIVSVDWILNKISFIPTAIYTRLPKLGADTIHPNVLAGSLVLVLPVILALILFGWAELKRIERILFLITVLVVGGMVVLTQSRGALMGLAVSLVLLITLRWRLGWLVWPLAAAVVIVVIATLGTSKAIDIVSSSSSVVNTTEGRVEIWSRALYMIRDFPFTGIGMGLFGDLADTLYPLLIAPPGSVPHAHNLFLQIAVDLGIPGLVAWLSILMLVVFTAWQVFQIGRTSHNHWVTGLGAGLLCSQVALVVHGLTDAVTWGMVRPAPLVWALWGLAMASGYVVKTGGAVADETLPV